METLKADVIMAMQTYFNGDTRRINHALKVTEYAEKLMKAEGGDYPVIIGAAVLHDIGIHEAERKYGSSSGQYQEKEGPPIARRILAELGFPPHQIEEISEIIGNHHSPGKINTPNFKILYDADWLVNLKDEYDIKDKNKLNSIINNVFLTESGQALAREIYLAEAK